MIVDVTISRCSFVFGQSRAKVTADFTNVSSLAVTAFDLVYCSLSVLRLSMTFTSVSSHCKLVIGLCATRTLYGCSIRVIVSERPLMYGTVAVVTRPELMLIYVGISVTVSIPSNKVRAVGLFY